MRVYNIHGSILCVYTTQMEQYYACIQHKWTNTMRVYNTNGTVLCVYTT